MSNAVVDSFLSDHCKTIERIVSGTLPAHVTTEEIAKALSAVKTRLNGIGPWTVNVRVAEIVLDARKKAENKVKAAEKAIADEAAKKVRMEANLRHKRNRAEKAEANRELAGKGKPQNGNKKADKKGKKGGKKH